MIFNFDDWYEENMFNTESKDSARDAWDAALKTAASRLNRLAMDDNTIRHSINIINDCKSKHT